VLVTAAAEASTFSEGTGSYAAQLVTIGKSAQSLREIPQSVSVVTRQMLEDQNIQSLDDAMRTVPGVTVEPGSTGGNHGNFYLRGYAVDTVQIDGVNTPASTGNDLSSGFGMAMYDRIEVLRGPAGLFQGPATLAAPSILCASAPRRSGSSARNYRPALGIAITPRRT
jgi:outer membrane receptor for ferric coprogen and ferric-rhodotorulic acid